MDGTRVRLLVACSAIGIFLLLLGFLFLDTQADPPSIPTSVEIERGAATVLDEVVAAPERSSFAEVAHEPLGPAPSPAVVGELSGTLLDSRGVPITGSWSAGVSLIEALGSRRHSDARETGAYSFRDLPFGTYSLLASATGFLQVEDVVAFGQEAPVVHKNITLVPQPALRIRVVTPDGRGIVPALTAAKAPFGAYSLIPVATREDPGESFDAIEGSANNRFGVGSFWNNGPLVEGLGDDHLGVLLVHCPLPVRVSLVLQNRVLRSVQVEPGAEEVTFVLSVEELLSQLAVLRFRIEDAATGRGIPKVRTMLISGGGIFNRTGADDGTTTIEGLGPGKLRFRVHVAEHESWEHSVYLKPGLNDLGTRSLAEAIRLVVRVKDRDGSPRSAKFHLRVLDPETLRVIDRIDNHLRSAPMNGVLELTDLGRKLYCLQVSRVRSPGEEVTDARPWTAGNLILDTRDGPIPDVDLVLEPAVQLVLSLDDPEPENLDYEIVDERGIWVAGNRFIDRLPWPIDLVPGTYRVALRERGGKEITNRTVTLGSEPVAVVLSR